MDVKVSVVIAAYNSEKYIRQTLKSVAAQSIKEIEIICVDDGSTDHTLEILREFEECDSRIRVLVHTEKTDGAAAARNLGISYATGKYLSVLDADDFFEPDMLEKAVHKAETCNAEIVIFDGYVFDENTAEDREEGFILHREYLVDSEDIFAPEEHAEVLFQLTLGAAWNCLFERRFISKYGITFQSFHHADDLGFVYLAFAMASSIAVIKERLLHYRMNNAASQAANIGCWPETSYLSLENLKKSLTVAGKYECFKSSFIKTVLEYVSFYLHGTKDYQDFKKLYYTLKSEYFEKLDVNDISDAQIGRGELIRFRKCVNEMSPGEYIYRKANLLSPFDSEWRWKNKLEAGMKVIVYGAGKRGKEIFVKLVADGDVKVTAWMDQEYLKKGYPVCSPELIHTIEFDLVLIAVNSENLYGSIRNCLVRMGVPEKKLLWVGENTKCYAPELT